MQCAGGIRQHFEHVVFRLGRIGVRLERPVGVPTRLPLPFNRLWIVFNHGSWVGSFSLSYFEHHISNLNISNLYLFSAFTAFPLVFLVSLSFSGFFAGERVSSL